MNNLAPFSIDFLFEAVSYRLHIELISGSSHQCPYSEKANSATEKITHLRNRSLRSYEPVGWPQTENTLVVIKILNINCHTKLTKTSQTILHDFHLDNLKFPQKLSWDKTHADCNHIHQMLKHKDALRPLEKTEGFRKTSLHFWIKKICKLTFVMAFLLFSLIGWRGDAVWAGQPLKPSFKVTS